MVRVSNENMPMKMMLFALVFLAFQSAGADLLSGRVVSVADGDTLTVWTETRTAQGSTVRH